VHACHLRASPELRGVGIVERSQPSQRTRRCRVSTVLRLPQHDVRFDGKLPPHCPSLDQLHRSNTPDHLAQPPSTSMEAHSALVIRLHPRLPVVVIGKG